MQFFLIAAEAYDQVNSLIAFKDNLRHFFDEMVDPIKKEHAIRDYDD